MRYKFAPYKAGKVTCPSCGYKKRWSRYIDENGMLLDGRYGRCDREISCGYSLNPNFFPPKENEITDTKVEPKEEKDYYNVLPKSTLTKSLINQFNDNFSKFIINTFGEEAKEVLAAYTVGCYGKYCNTVFWQIDGEEIRSGKIINYNVKTGKRQKDYISWVHSALKIPNFSLRQVLFGLPLLKKYPEKKVGITEAEKTAIIAAISYPQLVWLSCGQLFGLSEDKLSVLEGREVLFYSDKGRAKHVWENRLKKLNLPFKYQISEFMEIQDDLEDGSDLADYILANQKKLSKKNLAV